MNRADALARHLDLPYGVGRGGVPATYHSTATGQTWDAVPVVVRRNAQRVDDTGYLTRRDLIHMRSTAIEDRPRVGDRVTLATGAAWEVQSWDEADDGARLILIVRALPQ